MIRWLWWSSGPGVVDLSQIRVTQQVRLVPIEGDAQIRVTQNIRLTPIEGDAQIRVTQDVRLVPIAGDAQIRVTQQARLLVIEDYVAPTSQFPALTVAI